VTSTATPPVSTGGGGKRRAPRKRRRLPWPLLAVLGLLLAALVGAVIWAWSLASGVLAASRTVQDKAAVAQAELQAFRDTLKLGDEVTAEQHLAAGEKALEEARVAAQSDDVRTAKGLPYVGRTVEDLDHLLAAAGIMTDSARDALVVYRNFSGQDSELFRNSKFSIPAIEEAQTSVAAIERAIGRAETQLRQVDGDGPKGDEVLEKKRSGLRQIASLREEIVSLGPLLEAMPAAVGAEGKKTYLIAIMNPTEMRASGGAPLSVAFVQFKNGKMTIPLKGTTSELTGLNAEFYWDRLTGKKDPFALAEGEAERFVNTNFNPNFAVSGEQMVRATPANFGVKTDGVIALDIVAIGHLLDHTGPIQSEAYGKVTSKNIARKLLMEAYTLGSDDISVAARHDSNEELMTVMMSRLTEGGGLIGKARALGKAMPGRHLQLYFSDDRLQNLVVEKGMGGTIPVRDTGNLTAVYTQNGNGNKLDVYQRRTVREVVRLREDGSAVVRRTVALENPTPPYTAPYPDRKRGYDTRWANNLVINLMAKGTKVTDEPEVELVGTVGKGVNADGLQFAKAATVLPPDGSDRLTWEFVVPHAAVRKGDVMYFRNYVAPQPMLNFGTLQLSVIAPKGWTAKPAEGWKAAKKATRTEVVMDSVQVLKLRLER
jgi:hypothetical protein